MQLKNIVNIVSTDGAFAALRNDGFVITWGSAERGNYMSTDEYSKITSGVKPEKKSSQKIILYIV